MHASPAPIYHYSYRMPCLLVLLPFVFVWNVEQTELELEMTTRTYPTTTQNYNMAETTGSDAAPKKVVMVTGGTGLVGCGIKEFVSNDAEVRVLKIGENRHWCGIHHFAAALCAVLGCCCCCSH